MSSGTHAEYGAMEECAAQLRVKQETLISTLTEMNELVAGLTDGAFVTDSASQTFADACSEFVQNNQTNLENVESFATWLEGAVATLQGTDGDLAASVSA
jgi:uncharacterized protein YukE